MTLTVERVRELAQGAIGPYASDRDIVAALTLLSELMQRLNADELYEAAWAMSGHTYTMSHSAAIDLRWLAAKARELQERT